MNNKNNENKLNFISSENFLDRVDFMLYIMNILLKSKDFSGKHIIEYSCDFKFKNFLKFLSLIFCSFLENFDKNSDIVDVNNQQINCEYKFFSCQNDNFQDVQGCSSHR